MTRIKFPCADFQQRPVEFARLVLGVEPWRRQTEIMEAVRDHPRCAFRSGHKIGKSSTAALLAWWWYSSWPDARVVMTSTTSRQVDAILWREVRLFKARGGRCVVCKREDPEGLRIPRPCDHSALIEGEPGELARTGIKSHDFREIVGFTAKEAEAVAGVSGSRLLYLADEASGIPDVIFEAIEGNRAGGGRIAMFGNPTRNQGEFYDAFNSKKKYYYTLTISSEESPNVTEGRTVIPGLADPDWIREKEDEWGRDSALFIIRVLGRHAEKEEGKIFSVAVIAASEQRWPDASEAGRLYIGLDPAGETGSGDETVFVARRGFKMLRIQEFLGLNDEQHKVRLLDLIKSMKLPRETPVVVMDREGSIGARLYGYLQALINEPRNRGLFELVGIRASDRAQRQPILYDRARDELCANFEGWIRDGGALLEDSKLAKELHTLEWTQLVKGGRLKIQPKRDLKKLLGRSPDRYDAAALSVWEPLSLRSDTESDDDSSEKEQTSLHDSEHVMDPYGGAEAWRTR